MLTITHHWRCSLAHINITDNRKRTDSLIRAEGIFWFSGPDDGWAGYAGYGETRSVETLLLAFSIHFHFLCVQSPTPHILNLVQCAVGLVLSFPPLASVFSGTRGWKSWSLSPHQPLMSEPGLIWSYLGAPMQQAGQMQGGPGVQMQGMQPGVMGQQQGPRSSE